MMKWISWRGGVALCLASALVMTSLGCQQANHSGSAPGTSKPTTQKPENNKSKPDGQPKPDPG